MANVSEQVLKREDFTENPEALTIQDDRDFSVNYTDDFNAEDNWELSGLDPDPAQDLSEAIKTESVKKLPEFLPELNFTTPPRSFWQGRKSELAELNRVLGSNSIVEIAVEITGNVNEVDTEAKTGLVAKFFQDDVHPTKFWVDAYIHSFTDFAQWAIAYFSKINHAEDFLSRNEPTADCFLISTLIDLIHTHSCLLVIDRLDLSPQKEFWSDFIQALEGTLDLNSPRNPDRDSAPDSKIIVINQSVLQNAPTFSPIHLSQTLNAEESVNLLLEMGIQGDRQDLANFGQLLGGNLLGLILAANLLKAEEQIPQIRYLVRYGNVFDLNKLNRLVTPQNVFERSFKRLLPKLRHLLVVASTYNLPFDLEDLKGMLDEPSAIDSNVHKDLCKDLDKLEQLGLIQNLGQSYYCQPQIKKLIPIADPKPYHEQAIKYLWTQVKSYFEWESDRDLAAHLAIFARCCALEEYYRAFYTIYSDRDPNDKSKDKSVDQSVDRYLETQGKHILRISLFQPLLKAWREIKADRFEFGVVLMGIGDAYTQMHKYDRAIPLYQEWLTILVKRQDPLERRAKAQCLYKLASARSAQIFSQISGQISDRSGLINTKLNNHDILQVLPQYQESLEIAVRSGDRLLELNNLLGIGNLYFSLKEYTQALEFYERHLHLARDTKNIPAQIDCLPQLASTYKSVKQYDRALEIYRTHLTLISGSNYGLNRVLRVNSLENLAHTYQILGEYTQAKTCYQECLVLIDELKREKNYKENHGQRANCLHGLGINSDRLGQFKEAITYYQQALEIFTEAESPECSIDLANAHNSLGQYKEAVIFYEKPMRLALKNNDRGLQAKCLIGLGNVQNLMGKLVKAIQFYEQAWEISKDDPDQQAIALGNLGNVYNALGQYQEAMELYKQSLAIAKQVQDLGQQALCLNSLGQVLDRLGYYTQALQFYQEWIDLKKGMGDRSASLASLNRSSNFGLAQSKYAQAIEFHQQWIDVKRKMGDRQGEANSLGNLGNAFFAIGQYPQAIQAYQQCLEIARAISCRRSEASSLSGLGSAFFALGQYTQAIEFQERCLEISQKIDDLTIQAKTLTNLGKAYYSLGQYLQAEQKYIQSLQLIQKIGNRQAEANILGDLGNTHYALGKYPQAIEFYRQWLDISTEIGDRAQEGNALGGLGNSHNALGMYAQAGEFYQQWLEIAREIGDRRSLANALAGLGNAYNSLGEYTRAIEFHQQSLKIQKENSDRFNEKSAWTSLVDTLETLEQKSLTSNPYKSIDVQSSDRDESAIHQLLEAGAIAKDVKKNLQVKTDLKTKPAPKSWLKSTFGWLTGKS